jgi:hypothetical protein
MKTSQAWGWLAAGVLAAGLNAQYHDGGLQWAHRVANRFEQNSSRVLATASGQAGQLLAEARLLTARNETASCPLATLLERVQTTFGRSQRQFGPDRFDQRQFDDSEEISAQRDVKLARFGANRDRMEAQIAAAQAHFRIASANFAPVAIKALPAPVICPRVRVNMPKLPMMKMQLAPQIHVELAGAGPV